MKKVKIILILVTLAVLGLLSTGTAAAVADSFGAVEFHPFTMDGGNSTCLPWNEPETGPTNNCDPVNLLFLDMTLGEVQGALEGAGWSVTGTGSDQVLHFEDPYTMTVQDLQMALGGLFNRYHMRLWQAPGAAAVVAGVHHESGLPHQIDMPWETAEADVRAQLCGIGFVCGDTGTLGAQEAIQALDDDGDNSAATWRGFDNDLSATTITPESEPPPPPPPPPSEVMHVGGIEMAVVKVFRNQMAAEATVTVVDATGSPVSGALIEGAFSGDSGATGSQVSDANGQTVFQSPAAKGGASWVFCVTGASKAGWSYDEAVNVETCDTTDGSPPPPPAETLAHIANLDGYGAPGNRNRWEAVIQVTAHDENHQPVVGFTVSGAWSGGISGGGSCVTGENGYCEIVKANLKSNVAQVTFTVENISDPGGAPAYDPALNHDPDGSSVTVVKP